MKVLFITISVIAFCLFSSIESHSNFEYRLSSIAQDFKNEIMNKIECQSLILEAGDLADDIEDEIEKDGYSYYEVLELKKLKNEAQALEKFIAVVGNCGTNFISIEEFNLANQRVNASVNYLLSNEYCVDIILVQIGDYVVYLLENNSPRNYTVSYKWKAKEGLSNGSGKIGLSKYGIRDILSNREKSTKSNISFFEISCKEF